MLIYLENILISGVLFFIGNYAYKSRRKSFSYILPFLMIIVISSIIAGLRSNTVGTDVRNYAEPLQHLANMSDNYFDFINNYAFPNVEKGYLTIIFVVSRFTQKLFVSQLVIEVIIMSTLIFGILKFERINKKSISFVIGIIIFYCFFYNLSFNMIRQSVAIFILFYSFNFLLTQNYIKYFIGVIIAVTFHNSAIISIVIFFIYILTYDKSKKIDFKIGDNLYGINTVMLNSVMLILISFIIILSAGSLVNVLHVIGLDNYIDLYMSNFGFNVSLTNLIPRLLLVGTLIIEWKEMKIQKNKLRYFYIVIALIDLLLFQVSGYAYRIGWYTTVFYIYSISDALADDNNKVRRNSIIVFLIVALFIYWYMYTVVANLNETVPYIFGNFN